MHCEGWDQPRALRVLPASPDRAPRVAARDHSRRPLAVVLRASGAARCRQTAIIPRVSFRSRYPKLAIRTTAFCGALWRSRFRASRHLAVARFSMPSGRTGGSMTDRLVRNILCIGLAVVAVLLCTATPVSAQDAGTISGVAIDAASRAPLPSAQVQ